MVHGNKYLKIKRRRLRKALCSNLASIDSFALFRNKIAARECLDTVAYELTRFNLKATLRESSYEVQYGGGSYTISVEE